MTDSPAPTDPPAPPEPAAARWPEWFHALDVAAAAVALAAAFLAASYTARNSNLFLHLAGGKALVQGRLSPGGDPFTHAGAAGRPWADTSWLFDLLAYAVYSADVSGAALVATKAVGVAAGLGLLFLLRAPGKALWPWVVGVVLAAVAVADMAVVSSGTASVLFLAITLVLLFRLNWSRPGWRNPLLLGGLFAVWANTDGWFLLGPVVTAVVFVGGLADRTSGRHLGRGLLVGLAGCLLNPFVLAAVAKSPAELAQLVPWEFGLYLPTAVADDAQLNNLQFGPLSPPITDRLARGDDPNLPALGALALLAVVGGTLSRSVTTGLLVLLAAGVGLLNLRLTPYAAVLLVPPVGWGFNHLAGRVTGGRAGDPGTRILVTLSGLGRFLTLLAGVAVGVAAYPGWLHPTRNDPAYGRVYSQRVEWAVEPDPSLARAAAMLATWPAERKALAVGPDLANYAAWFAPGVRQFVNSRYVFHRADLPDLLAVRVGTLGRRDLNKQPTELPDLEELAAATDRQGAGYLVVTSGSPPRRVDDTNLLGRQMPAVYALGLYSGADWTLWHLDGRSAVIGRGTGGPALNLAAAAFRPGEPVPAGPTTPPPLPPSDDSIVAAVEQARNPIRPVPAEADDAQTLAGYLGLVRQQENTDFQRRSAPPRGALGGGPGLLFNLPVPRPATDAEFAGPVLAVRAARLAVVAAPDRPEPYRALMTAYSLPLAPVVEGRAGPISQLFGMSEGEAQQFTAAARFLARLPAATVAPELRGAGLEAAMALAERFEQTGQFDLARAAVEAGLKLLERLPRGGKDDPLADLRKRLDDRAETYSAQIQRRAGPADRETNPGRKFLLYVQAGLPGKALDLFQKTEATSFGKDLPRLALLVVEALLRAGRLEDADRDLAALEDGVRTAGEAPADLVERLRFYRDVVARLAGDSRAAVGSVPQVPLTPPAGEVQAVLDAPRKVVGFAAAAGMAAGWARNSVVSQQAQGLLLLIQTEIARQTDRGLLALIDGDPTEAGRRFDAAQTPLGLSLADFDPQLADRLARYRALIRTHAGK